MRNACQSFCMHGIWGEKRWLFVIALRGGVSIAASVALLVVQLQQTSLTKSRQLLFLIVQKVASCCKKSFEKMLMQKESPLKKFYICGILE